MKERGFTEKKLQLLCDITGTFRPGILTALMGVSGAGKTTLLDVLAGRKTSGTVEGEIKVGGFPKVQKTFSRISGYCEQSDIHSPQITVEESVMFSAWLRLDPGIDSKTKSVSTNWAKSQSSCMIVCFVFDNVIKNFPVISVGFRKRSTWDHWAWCNQRCLGRHSRC